MQFDNERPIYLQIKEDICRQIARGELCPGEKMQSLRDMALLLRVNPNTVQRAYRELEQENVLFSRRGQGTYVSEEEDVILALRRKLASEGTLSYLEHARALGLTGEEILGLVKAMIDEEGY
ncbi:MAG: GntR family transcriptional regulator [Dethiobacter sp.]|jgi:GntR family transcriptional regulator|nr:GntR family transcriptional regulator [Dethiobacter sp.]